MFKLLWSRTRKSIRRGSRGQTRRRSACRLGIEALESRTLLTGDMVLRWNEAMLAAVRTAGQSPPVGARSEAIVELAVFEAVNSIDGSYNHYLVDIPAPPWASKEAAAAEAAHDALVGLFPAQAPVLDLELLASLQGIPAGEAKTWGINVGRAAAQIMLAVRAHDGSDRVVTYTPGTNPGDWQPTPPAYGPPQVPQWPGVTPFALQSGAQFRPPPPPALDSPEYAAAFDEVRDLGALDSSTRTADQTEAAMFWQGVVTQHAAGWWNEIARRVAVDQGNSLVDNARMFALLNMTQADAFIAAADGKYTYNFWRPVTAIRYDTDPGWTPLMATPSHPSYPSNHATVSTAAGTALASFFGTDAVPFSFSWEGLPGVTRSFDSFSAASQEAGNSRIWAGFHWRFDLTAGEALGQSVGAYVSQHFLLPRAPGHGGGAIGLHAAAGLDGLVLPVPVNLSPAPAPSPSGSGLGPHNQALLSGGVVAISSSGPERTDPAGSPTLDQPLAVHAAAGWQDTGLLDGAPQDANSGFNASALWDGRWEALR
jgi:hypothetical protein